MDGQVNAAPLDDIPSLFGSSMSVDGRFFLSLSFSKFIFHPFKALWSEVFCGGQLCSKNSCDDCEFINGHVLIIEILTIGGLQHSFLLY